MGLYQLVFSVFLLGSASAPQTPPTELGNPFVLKKAEFDAGNPLARYVEQVRLEAEYEKSEDWRSVYWQSRSTLASVLGDMADADRSWDRAMPSFATRDQVLVESPLAAMKAEDAVAVIARAARKHAWIMVGEEHVKPQSRTLLVPLIRVLHRQGFRTLAAETFSGNSLDALADTRFPTLETGTYTVDPVFAEGVREAIRLGWRLVPYEAMERPTEDRPNDPEYRQNFRENLQAVNLKTRIFDRDPKAKVLVWAGRGHVLETATKGPTGGQWTPMAYEFKRLTGVDPFSVYAATYLERSERRFERGVYKWATDYGLIKRPSIFVDGQGKAFGEVFDAQVFFPRTTIVRGRPDWLFRDLGRQVVDLPAGLVKPAGLQLAQAFVEGEPATAVPFDQVLIRPGEPVPALALRRGGRYWVRVLDAEGKENGRRTVVVP